MVVMIIIGLGIVLLPVVAILARMLLPALAGAREHARRTVCMNNMNQIARALESYASDHNNQYPTTGKPGDSTASLALLCPKYIPDTRIFICLSAPNAGRRKAMSGPLTEANCSYTYDNTVPLKAASAERMLLWDKSLEHHREGRNVLFGDYRVEWMLEEEFQRRLAEQKSSAARAGEP